MLTDKVEAIIATLKSPLRPDEETHGWSQKKKDEYIPFFEKLLADVKAENDIHYLALARSLDMWGISQGELYELMMNTARELNIKQEKNKQPR